MVSKVRILTLMTFSLFLSASALAHKMPESEKLARATELIEGSSVLRAHLAEPFTVSSVKIGIAVGPNLDFAYSIPLRFEMGDDVDFNQVDFLVTSKTGKKFFGACYILTAETAQGSVYKYSLGSVYQDGCAFRSEMQGPWSFFAAIELQDWARSTKY